PVPAQAVLLSSAGLSAARCSGIYLLVDHAALPWRGREPDCPPVCVRTLRGRQQHRGSCDGSRIGPFQPDAWASVSTQALLGVLGFQRLEPRQESPSSLLKNLKGSGFVLGFSPSHKRSVRFGSECSRLVATLSL